MTSHIPFEEFVFPRKRITQLLCGLLCGTLCFQSISVLAQSRVNTVTISYRPGRPANRFLPAHAFGAGIDGHEKGETDRQLQPENIELMLSAGLRSLTYRLRTELAIDAWHWNPKGSWSEEPRQQGYWISDSTATEPIQSTHGYSLPRRGNTIDNANNEGYSRLDDGDTESFWKSNPYLDQHFTHEENALHPQWIVIEFNEPTLINAARVLWAEPCATSYKFQYGEIDDISDLALNQPGVWHDFPISRPGNNRTNKGSKAQAPFEVSQKPADPALSILAKKPIKTKFVRLLMDQSSRTGPAGSTDIRERVGFAVREIYLGSLGPDQQLVDVMQRGKDRQGQTIVHVSSTDPWHRAEDLDEGIEQPGFDRIFASGLTNDLPVLLATGILFDTPENAANEIRYLRSRGFKFERVEIGEEPDGHYTPPEDFGALYLQWANAIHAVDPSLKLGGPSFQEILPEDEPPAKRLGNAAWFGRFLRYLQAHGRAQDFSFFSFEWYPFDDVCQPFAPQLASATNLLTQSLREMQRRGLSRRIPWIISEYGYSAFGTRAEISIEGALLNADIVGRFLTLGGDQAFLYGYTPSEVLHDNPCGTPGQNMLFSMDEDGDITHEFATYFGAQLLTQEWAMPDGSWHEIYPAVSNIRNQKREELVTAYALLRPDGLWSVLLINKDPATTQRVRLQFHNESARTTTTFNGRVDLYQFSGAQYQLNDDRENPFPIKAEPPEHRVIESAQTASFELPAYSLTVIRGSGPAVKARTLMRR